LIYLDNAATTRSLPEAVEAAAYAMTEGYANPSALYNSALLAEKQMGETTNLILSLLGAQGYRLLYTSGGTEANNLALRGTLPEGKRCRVLVSSMEHPSVAQSADALERAGHEVVRLDCRGGLNLAQLEEELKKGCDLLSVMHVNNETGMTQDLEAIGQLLQTHAPKALFHVDGVQAFLRLPLRLPAARIDLYTLSGHKIHGIKGIGGLVVRNGVQLRPQLLGGGQQEGLRPGTQNMPGIAALGAACRYWKAHGDEERARLREMKLCLAETILAACPKAVINGPCMEEGAPHILSVGFPGVRGETLLHALETEDVCVGTGSACSSHKKGVSAVLLAQGVPEKTAQGTIRLSLGLFNTMEEMKQAGEAIGRQATRLARFQRR